MKTIIKELTLTSELEEHINLGWEHYHTYTTPNTYADRPNYLGQPREFWLPDIQTYGRTYYMVRKTFTDEEYKNIKKKERKAIKKLLTTKSK